MGYYNQPLISYSILSHDFVKKRQAFLISLHPRVRNRSTLTAGDGRFFYHNHPFPPLKTPRPRRYQCPICRSPLVILTHLGCAFVGQLHLYNLYANFTLGKGKKFGNILLVSFLFVESRSGSGTPGVDVAQETPFSDTISPPYYVMDAYTSQIDQEQQSKTLLRSKCWQAANTIFLFIILFLSSLIYCSLFCLH